MSFAVSTRYLQSKLPEDQFFVDSAGTGAYHLGQQPDVRSINVAKQNGIDIRNQSARQFKVSDFDAFDVIYAMDESNYKDIIRLARNNQDTDKVKFFLDANPHISNTNVPDPYHGNAEDFKAVFSLIELTCTRIVKQLTD